MKTKLLLFAVIVLLTATSHLKAQQTTHSTFAGGWWPDAVTWFETVPTTADSVVIQGPVGTYSWSGWCKSLNITETGSLGGNGNQGNLFIYGSLYNNGNIFGSINYTLAGNIVNLKPWTGVDSHINFSGMDHTLTCAKGASINAQLEANDSLHNFTLLSDVILNTPNTSNLGFSQLEAGTHKLHINNGGFTNCRIHSLDTLQVDSWVSGLEITGDYKLTGNIVCYFNLSLFDKATNYGSIHFASGVGGDPLKLKGDFINEGTMNHDWVQVEKNIANHGIWSSFRTEFTGAGDKHISQSSGHPFGGGEQFMSDNSGSTIFLDTDVEFTVPTFHLNNYTLNCGNHMLTANTAFFDGTIHTESEITGNSDFWNSSFTGDFTLTGNNRFSNCTVNGTIENTGMMKDITYYGGLFKSYGHLINHSSIQSMHLNIYGNLTNYGSIDNNSIVDVTGNIAQYITMTQSIESQTNFYSDITGTNYQWMKDGQDILNASSVYLRFTSLQLSDAGVYKCRVITSGGGTEYSREIIVNNTTGLGDIGSNALGVEFYPNPVQEKLWIESEKFKTDKCILTILDFFGRKLMQKEVAAGTGRIEIELGNFRSGIYFCRISSGNQSVISKICKQ